MAKDDTIRLFVTLGERLYRDALLYQLLLEHQVDLIGEAATGIETLNALEEQAPGVLLIEEALTDNDGLTVAEVALSRHPTLNVALLVDRPVSPSRLAIYLDAGIKTVVAKSQSLSELSRALHAIRHGHLHVAQSVCQKEPADSVELQAFRSLSAREQEVARLLAERMEFKTIAEQMGVSYKTVHSYKDRIFVKMGFERVPELILFMKRCPGVTAE